jgi:glycerophosphoryl diester phosphodiesterase
VRRAVLLLLVGLALAVALESRAAGPVVRIAAHRGGAGLWPEASLLAFRQALGLGVDFLEFDLHMTRDGELVVIHDATLDRTTTAQGAVHDLTLTQLAPARIRARDGSVTDEPVPTFAELLDLAAPAAVEILPEIKVGLDGKPYLGIEAKVIALLRARGMLGRAIVQAFEASTIRRLLTVEPTLRTMLLVSRARVQREHAAPGDVVRWVKELGATDLGMDHRIVDAAVITEARKAGIRVSAWTVNDEIDLRRMFGLGVDVVMTDRPDLAKRLLGR